MTLAEDLAAQITEALRRVAREYETSPIEEPSKATAIVADLIADARRDSSGELIALRALLLTISDAAKSEQSISREEAISRAAGDRVSREVATQVLSAMASAIDLPLTERHTQAKWRWPAAAIGVVAVIGVVTLASGGQDGGALTTVETAPTTSAAPTSSSSVAPTTTAATVSPGVLAEFPVVKEGQFLVERGWRVTPGGGELVGLVRLTPSEGPAASGVHRELVPPMAVPDPTAVEWDPIPNAIANHVASYTVSLDDEGAFVIEFRAPLETGQPKSEIDVLNWFEDWKPAAEELRSVLGDSGEILEPILSSSSSG